MRQGNGSDLLGLKDPRSTKIGIIYVGPSDDRKNVLTAILTQEKLGRKQIAIVLPQNQPNKAFQRPQDFDDLKTVRRKLRAQLIFIAPPGSGPAEFARQRRFSVYSSLESYTNALRAESSLNETRAKRKKGRLFSFGEKAVPLAAAIAGKATIIDFPSKKGRFFSFAPSTPNNAIAKKGSNRVYSPYADLPTVDLGQQALLSQRSGDSSLPTSTTGTMDTSSPLTDKNPVAAASDTADLITHDTQQPVALDESSASVDEDWDALPPVPLVSSPQTNAPVASLPPDTTPSSPLSSTPETSDSTIEAGPSIIELSPSPRVSPDRATAKPFTVGAESIATSIGQLPTVPLASNRPSQGHHTGKTAAMIGTKAVAPVQQKVGMGRSSVHGTQSTQAGITRKRSSSNNLHVVFAIIAVLLLIVVGVASCLLNPFASAKTVITITPRNAVEQKSYVIQAVTSYADPAKRQISLRQLTFSPSQQSKVVTATGHAKAMAKAATGQLTFYNGSATQDYWIGSDIPIPGPNGVSVVPDSPVDVPAGSPPTSYGTITVNAHATTAGENGNMAADAINRTCCAASGNITVVSSAFTGGQDGENYTYLQRSDVDKVVNPLKPVLSQQAQKGFNSQIKPNEQLVGTPQCTTTPKANPPIGKQGKNVASANVTVSITCTGSVYDASGARTLAQNLLTRKAASSLGQGYVLAGTIITTKPTVTDVQDDVVTLQVAAAGIWNYQFNDSQKQTLAKQLVNASRGTAQKLLNDNKEIANARVDLADGGDMLPNDPNQIRITVVGVSGASPADLPVMPAT